LGWLHNKGISVTMNLHDADGVRPNEKMFSAYATALGLNPNTCGTIPFTMVNASMVYGLEVPYEHLNTCMYITSIIDC